MDAREPRNGPPIVPPISAPIQRSGSGGHIGFVRQQSESARANQNRARNNFGEVDSDQPEKVRSGTASACQMHVAAHYPGLGCCVIPHHFLSDCPCHSRSHSSLRGCMPPTTVVACLATWSHVPRGRRARAGPGAPCQPRRRLLARRKLRSASGRRARRMRGGWTARVVRCRRRAIQQRRDLLGSCNARAALGRPPPQRVPHASSGKLRSPQPPALRRRTRRGSSNWSSSRANS